MEINMGYPSRETIEAFKQIVEKDGLEEILGNLVNASNMNKKLSPIVGYLKEMIFLMIDDGIEDEMSAYTNGFISCLDLFRRQITSDEVTLDDVNIQIENMIGWTNFLELENVNLKNELNNLKIENMKLTQI